ncbi:zinc finger protein 888-like [Mytilus trossulus]|uniref:zinc finger protein 888-like n=1 Tax=Mytilus trossulus TaxID=6551 RepID=UPI003005343A
MDAEKAEKLCKICGKSFRSISAVYDHERRHAKKGPYKCCGKVFFSKANIKRHRCAVHGEEKTFACEQCDKRFSIMADLTRHLKIHEEHPVKFKCTVCGLEFKKAHDCGDHEASHRGDTQHRCTCGKAYIHQTNLYRHKRKCNH